MRKMSLWGSFLLQASVHTKTSTTNQESLSAEAVTSASVMTLVITVLREYIIHFRSYSLISLV